MKLVSVQCVKDLGVTIASNLKLSQLCEDTASKANRMQIFQREIYNSTSTYQFIQTTFEVQYAAQYPSP